MAYFPAFLKLDHLKILIVGGGNIATEKLIHMLEFTTNISVISPKLSDTMLQHIAQNNLTYTNRVYQTGDIDGFGIVIVAVDDVTVQKEIYEEAQGKNILCNAVDSVAYCDFIFPSYIKKGDLTMAISTSGSSPAVAKQLRRFLEKVIPDSIGEFLQEMKTFRKTMPKGKDRMKFLEQKAKNYFDRLS
ncbi:MAG: bifunctional precorrin-2 dehydrogenase/sirohydrochlorin ferrochelatase [Epsilonproteobacteria bacterium]|nr:bifunctional precorrin-2 dehydrogenase/sirohydrochlorin ferrochelatase [Campylobacterota bacterium]